MRRREGRDVGGYGGPAYNGRCMRRPARARRVSRRLSRPVWTVPGRGHWPATSPFRAAVIGHDLAQPVEWVAVDAGRGGRGAEGVEDRFFGVVGDGFEEGRHRFVEEHPKRDRLAHGAGPGQVAISGREGEEDVASAVFAEPTDAGNADWPRPRQAEGPTLW